MKHLISIKPYKWEFEGSHGRTSEHFGLRLNCSCGWVKSTDNMDEKEVQRKITDHKIDVLAAITGIEFVIVREER